jgi:hypothetical protein
MSYAHEIGTRVCLFIQYHEENFFNQFVRLVWHVSGIILLVYSALITMQLILLTQLTHGSSFSSGHMVPSEPQTLVENKHSTSVGAEEVLVVQ